VVGWGFLEFPTGWLKNQRQMGMGSQVPGGGFKIMAAVFQ
jgi:hypothetical protein